ncbi:unnamed protein product [Meloidogyne enterolobii]|uniref:Uncharacterized protein n=1 Tax=Meloidogyne enterolobii TaxID=390850 RepID=A0ACB0ZTA7_MELEN
MLEMPDYQAHDPRKIVIWCLANLLRGGMNDIELDVSLIGCCFKNKTFLPFRVSADFSLHFM